MDKLLQELDTFFKDNKWNQIVKKTKSIINTNKAIPPYFNLVGLSLSKLGKDLDAKKTFLEGINKFPDEISLKSNVALVLTNLKEYDLAEKHLNDGEKINKDDIFLFKKSSKSLLIDLKKNSFSHLQISDNFLSLA